MKFRIIEYYAEWSLQTKGRIRLVLEDNGQKTLEVVDPLEFQVIVDLLRNEKPMFFLNGNITTSREPVGEGE
jgi:hypothetical protein